MIQIKCAGEVGDIENDVIMPLAVESPCGITEIKSDIEVTISYQLWGKHP